MVGFIGVCGGTTTQGKHRRELLAAGGGEVLPVCAGLQTGPYAGGQQGHVTKGQSVDLKTGISL